jgi:formate dehydrogenase iron-sulfur subunit
MSLNRRQFLKLAGVGAGAAILAPKGVAAAGRGDPVNSVSMLYDSTMCIGCRACQTGCRNWNRTKDERDETGLYDAPKELSADTWTLIQLYEEGGRGAFVKHQCMHCLHPACASACPVGALQKTAEGPVTYDHKRCIGCRYCMVACPFGVPRFDWDLLLPVVSKCTFCADRLAVGDGPACVEACPTGALIWGQRGDLLDRAKERLAASPDRYVNHIYGEHDAGGTSVLYLSNVPFEKLGLPNLGDEAVPALNDALGPILLPSLFAGGLVLMVGARYLTGRQSKEA